jgi:uracil-DNA glycosylase family protein
MTSKINEVRRMPARKPETSAADFLPHDVSLPALRAAAAGCRGCDLYRRGTQTVFGEGEERARVMLVGEQPGDKEDIEGRPFVGPAGKLLDRALEEAGIDRRQVYVTNAVKHFKWEPRGKRRIHTKPNSLEIAACRPWFDAELKVVRPEVVVCLGASAAQMIVGKSFRVTQQRGEFLDGQTLPIPIEARVVATVHPSSILRAEDDESRRREYDLFVADLEEVAVQLRKASRAA